MRWRLGVVLTLLVSAASPAWAAPGRFAVVVGNDQGEPDEPRLRYAENDARRIAHILTTIGDFPPENTVLLEGRSAADVRAAVAAAEDRLARTGSDGVLLFYYSGHADGEALHLGGTALRFSELQSLAHEHAVATRVMIIDACRSGALTAIKGGHSGAGFEVQVLPAADPHGMAVITSSAAGEDSQESAELEASFFTHHLATGLLGAADRDGDGKVSLGEAYDYAAKHTIAATSTTWAGPQHPTYSLNLGGREDLILTRPGELESAASNDGSSFGHLTLRDPGWYFVRRKEDNLLVAEIAADAINRPLAVGAGRYEVVRRVDDHLLVGDFTVAASGMTDVGDAGMRRVDFGRVVRKGGTPRRVAFGVYADGGMRGSLVGLGAAPTAGVGGRLDLRGVTATIGLHWAESSAESPRGSQLDTTELEVRGDVMKAFDLSAITLAVGVEVGMGRFAQSSSDQLPPTASYAPLAGPTAVVEVPLGRRYFVWLQAAAPTYLVDVEQTDRVSTERDWRMTYRCTLATGGYL